MLHLLLVVDMQYITASELHQLEDILAQIQNHTLTDDCQLI